MSTAIIAQGGRRLGSLYDPTKAVKLDGITNYIRLSTLFSSYGAVFTNNTVISLWINTAATIPNGTGGMWGMEADTSKVFAARTTTAVNFRAFAPRSSGQAQGGGNNGVSSPLLVNRKHHLLIRHPNPTFTNPAVFLDGVNVTTGTGAFLFPTVSFVNGVLCIGFMAPTNYGNWKVADFGVWRNRIMTDAEVATVYNAGARHDLSLLGALAPNNFYNCGAVGDGPALIQDLAGGVNGSGVNLVAGDFVAW